MKVNYLLKMMVAVALMLVATTVKAADITVTGTDRAALVTALDAAQPGDVLLISQSIGIGEEQLTLTKNVTFRGDGDGIKIGPATGYTSRVLQIQPGVVEGEKLVFENLTFEGANNQGNSDGGEKDGGLGRLATGVIEFNNCSFIGNFSADRGGVFDAYGSTTTFTNCEFANNSTSGRGGALFVRGAAIINIRDSKVLNNNSTGRGGAFFAEGTGTLNIYNTLIKGNSTGTRTWSEVDNKFTYTGEGGAVFTTSGTPTIYVESSSIIENESNGDHGGILFAMGTPTVSFINTTLANNIMWKDSNSMFFLNDNGSFTFVNSTIAGNRAGSYNGLNFGPNAGNTTGINIRNAATKVKIINTIFVGNTANNGAAVDINYRNEIKDNVADVLEIRNSIVGFINNLSVGQIESIPGFETSVINSYPNSPDWKDTDKSGINWASGLKYTGSGEGYYPVVGSSRAVGLGDPALLATYITPLVDQLGTPRTGAKITSGAIEYVKGDNPLPLDNLNLISGGTAETPYSYDQMTHTLTYAGGWAGKAGWTFDPLEDWSDYSAVTIKFAAPLTTGVALHIEYTDAAIETPTGDKDKFVGAGSTAVTFALDKDLRNQVKNVYLSVQNDNEGATTGTLVLKDAFLVEEGYSLPYSIDELNYFNGTSYDEDTKVITYTGDWGYAGWNWEAEGGKDFSEFDQVWIKFDASSFANPADVKIQYEVRYMDGTTIHPNNGSTEVRATATEIYENLASKKVKYIFLKSQYPGTITLTDAYAFKRLVEPVDLTVEDVRWEPVNPKPGEGVTFYATVKNNSEIASPENTKHGVVFQVNGVTVTWADAFQGPIPAGGEVEISSRDEGSSGALWTTGKNPTYKIKAWVNDQKDVKETDYDNNYSEEFILTVDGKADVEISNLFWDLDEPKAGDKVTFSVKVVNSNGEVATPEGVITGVAFSVNNNVVSWSDNYTTSIPVGIVKVELIANGGPNNGDGTWTVPAAGGTFTIKAEVNDQKRYDELNWDNNIYVSNDQIVVAGVGILHVAPADGSVYAVNGKLQLTGYSANAAVTVYNLLGKQVAQNSDVFLSTGTYLVRIVDNGKLTAHKVLVK
jgi:hypothetical protein